MPKDPSTDRPELEVKPDPKLEKRTRRTFTADYKLRIIREADSCKHGEIGLLLRREKLYSNQLSEWRREFAENGIGGLEKSAPGPLSKRSPKEREIEKLKQQIDELNDKLLIAQDCIDIQKKVLSILDHSNSGNTP